MCDHILLGIILLPSDLKGYMHVLCNWWNCLGSQFDLGQMYVYKLLIIVC